MTRTLLLAIAATALLVQPVVARTLDPAKPEDALEINKRTTCGVADGVPAVYYFSGRVYSPLSRRSRAIFHHGQNR